MKNTTVSEVLASSPLPRLHLFEFHELPWFPETLRNAITEVLRVMCFHLHTDEVISPILETVLDHTDAKRIIDLCSGAGGPLLPIQQQLARCGRQISVMLTDKFPNRAAFHLSEEGSVGCIRAYMEPVDATEVPAELTGVRTLFCAFHQFPAPAARAILADAYASRQPIAIFEITERSLLNTLANLPLSFLTMLALLPRVQSRRPEWWLFTYVIPILPLAFGWDALVSCLRSYTASEFDRLKAGMDDESYSWSSGRVAVPGSPIHVTYFLGMPT